ncbi:MAG: glycosyltransferase family 9 protein [bacterium]
MFKFYRYFLMSALWVVVDRAFGLARAAGLLRGAAVRNAGVRRIAVMRTGAIGDVLMTTPALRRIRALFPAAAITYYTRPEYREALEGNPNLDGVEELVHPRSKTHSAAEKREFLRSLRRRDYDMALFFDAGGPYTYLPAWRAGIPARVGWNDYGRGFPLTHRIPRRWNGPGHMIDWYLDLLEPFGGSGDDRRMEIHWRPDDEAAVERFLAGAGHRTLRVALAPGGGENPWTVFHAKRWGKEKFAELAERVARELGAAVVLVGAGSDADAAGYIVKNAAPAPLNAVGALTLKQTAALLARCGLFIGNDSAPLHIAAAAGTPTVAIFGPTRPERLAPPGEGNVVVSAGSPCSPCYYELIGAFRKCARAECMEEISVPEVFDAALRLLERRGMNPGKGAEGFA